jgi:DNA repair protein RecO (recombination protein O)
MSCAATGRTQDLIYVSPRSGRAVSRDAGEEWRHRLLALPAFLAEETHGVPSAAELAQAFQLTGFFLGRDVLEPRNLTFSDARTHFIAAIARALPNAA